MVDLIDISRTQRDQNVPRTDLILQSCDDLVKGGDEAGTRRWTGDALNQFQGRFVEFALVIFSRSVDRRDEHLVRLREALAELRHQCLRSGDLMRLKDGPDPATTEAL